MEKGTKISFRDAGGNKHYGIIEDVIPAIGGGGIVYSVYVKAINKIMTVEQPRKLKR